MAYCFELKTSSISYDFTDELMSDCELEGSMPSWGLYSSIRFVSHCGGIIVNMWKVESKVQIEIRTKDICYTLNFTSRKTKWNKVDNGKFDKIYK